MFGPAAPAPPCPPPPEPALKFGFAECDPPLLPWGGSTGGVLPVPPVPALPPLPPAPPPEPPFPPVPPLSEPPLPPPAEVVVIATEFAPAVESELGGPLVPPAPTVIG